MECRPEHQPRTSIERGNSEERLRELIIYVAEKSQNDPYFGATKLNKILFFSDFLTYVNYGDPITGVEYQRLPMGPAPRRLCPIREELVRGNDIQVVSIPTPKGQQHRIIPRRGHKNVFSDNELRIVDAVIAMLRTKSSEHVSEMSHGPAWKSVQNSESIPYETAFVSAAAPTDDDKAWAMSAVKEAGVGA